MVLLTVGRKDKKELLGYTGRGVLGGDAHRESKIVPKNLHPDLKPGMETIKVGFVRKIDWKKFLPLLALAAVSGLEAQITRQHPGYALVDVPLASFNPRFPCKALVEPPSGISMSPDSRPSICLVTSTIRA